MAMIHQLRAEEGAEVAIMCPNPEGPPNEAVEITDDWTGWEPRRFTGDTLLQALEGAASAKLQSQQKQERGEPR
jgi:hypothetical protein